MVPQRSWTTKKDNQEGQPRRTKCPCFKSGNGCNEEGCACKNCGNPFGRKPESTGEKPKKNQTRKPMKKTFKRKRTNEYLAENGSDLGEGQWSNLETISLYDLLYLHVSDNKLKDRLPIRRKSMNQISFKMRHLELQYF